MHHNKLSVIQETFVPEHQRAGHGARLQRFNSTGCEVWMSWSSLEQQVSERQPPPETTERFLGWFFGACRGLVCKSVGGVFPLQPKRKPPSPDCSDSAAKSRVWLLLGVIASCRTFFVLDGEHAVAALVPLLLLSLILAEQQRVCGDFFFQGNEREQERRLDR